MKIGKRQRTDRIVIEEVPIEEVEDFCYLGSMMSSDKQLRQGNQNTDGQSKCCIRKVGKDMEKQWLQRRHKGPTIRVHSAEHTTIPSRDMANHSDKWQETGGGTSQMAEEDITCHMEGQNNKQGNQRKNRTGGAGLHHQKEKTYVAGSCGQNEHE